jgi:DNA-binding transcriptional regulator YhcF (GntR family)
MSTLSDPLLAVDRSDELPVGVQLAWRIRALIGSGALSPGERLPGLRDMAASAGVNVNTVRAILGRLEAEGLVASRQGAGTFVAAGAEAGATAARLAEDALVRARAEGVDPRDLARAIYAAALGPDAEAEVGEGTGLPDVGPAADEAAARRELRRQIGRLEAQLASYPEARSGRDSHPLLRAKAHVAGIGELEAVRDELMARLRRAREQEERQGKRQSRARGRRERIISDPEANRWQRVSRDEAGDPGCGETRSAPRFGPVGAVAGWWRVKVSSGCP